jgi:D-serine deaminase-like pyridoxal phosphate-dependent protein
MIDQATIVRSEIERTRERVRREYGAAIGRRRSELITPALVLDLPAAKRNIARMADQLTRLPAKIRPHIKVHKSPELSRLQVEAGAIGLSTATVWEACVLVHEGLDHIFVANTVAGPAKLRTLAELARRAEIMAAVDDAANAEALAAAARAAGTELGVFIEVDTGMDRCGVDSADEAVALARKLMEMPGLRFTGITGYEGHCSLTPDTELRHAKQRLAMDMFAGVAEQIISAGIPCPILSAGGTATWDWTAADPRISEIQAGSYVVMDEFHGAMVGGFENSLFVTTTVISRRPDRVIVDAGSKSMGAPGLSRIVGHDLPNHRFDEEHGIFVADERTSLRVGDVVELTPGYAPATVNWYDAFHVVEDDTVVDIWPVIPRGPGHHGLAAS